MIRLKTERRTNENENGFTNITSCEMLAGSVPVVTALSLSKLTGLETAHGASTFTPVESAKVSFRANGKAFNLEVDTRTTLLDGLR